MYLSDVTLVLVKSQLQNGLRSGHTTCAHMSAFYTFYILWFVILAVPNWIKTRYARFSFTLFRSLATVTNCKLSSSKFNNYALRTLFTSNVLLHKLEIFYEPRQTLRILNHVQGSSRKLHKRLHYAGLDVLLYSLHLYADLHDPRNCVYVTTSWSPLWSCWRHGFGDCCCNCRCLFLFFPVEDDRKAPGFLIVAR